MTVRAFDVKPIRGPWHIGSNLYSTRYVPGTSHLYERAKLGCLPGGAGHGGRDIHNDTQDNIWRAVWDGIIHRYPWDDYGNHIGLINSDGDEAFYAHGAAIHVSDGQAVKADTDLGILGESGQTSGPHLHFELRTRATQWCTAIDPTPYLLADPAPQEEDMVYFKKTTVSTVYVYLGTHISAVSDADWKAIVGALGHTPSIKTLPDSHYWFKKTQL